MCVSLSIFCRRCIKTKGKGTQRTQHSAQVFGVSTLPLLLLKKRLPREVGLFWSTKTYHSPVCRTICLTHAPGVPAWWPMRGSWPSTPSWTGVVSCSVVITMVFSSTSSQVGFEKADSGRVILCISRSYTRCSCCFFKSRALNTNTQIHDAVTDLEGAKRLCRAEGIVLSIFINTSK